MGINLLFHFFSASFECCNHNSSITTTVNLKTSSEGCGNLMSPSKSQLLCGGLIGSVLGV